jgi:alkanesulfonate monooxygenase SsuD/methylene tetrahydromethanopterin reductase-like flavin-dependent oxidoreductase (luciferase family)
MKFGLIYELALPISEEAKGRTEEQVYWEAVEQVVKAEEVGFDYVWLVEHHFLEDLSRCSAPEVVLSAFAQHTKKIRIGHGVVLTPPPFNHPFKVAEKVAALDIMSRGRVEFGAGRSITMEELGGFGVDPADAKPMMLEALSVVPKIWKERLFPGYEGKYFNLPPRVVVPKPIQKPHPPMWMACSSPSSYAQAGSLGLGCLSFTTSTPAALKPALDNYRAAIKTAVPPGEFVNEQVAGFTVLYCDDDQERAIRRAGTAAVEHMKRITRYFGDVATQPGYTEYTAVIEERIRLAKEEFDPVEKAKELAEAGGICIGDPAHVVRTIGEYRDIGIDQFMGVIQFSDVTHEESLRTLKLMGHEVIPRFR